MSRDIVFSGFAHAADLPHLTAGADLVVFPSLYEGFGLPILEAMACGVPVACSNTSSMPEVAGDAAMMFDPFDVDAMTDAMLTILSDPALGTSLRVRGLAQAARFTWQASAARTLAILRLAREERI